MYPSAANSSFCRAARSPLPVRPGDAVGAAVGEGLHPHLRVGGPGGLLEDPRHALVGRERLAFGDPQRGELTVQHTPTVDVQP
jgi:hypothetical protein